MKRIVSLLLAFAMALSLTLGVSAREVSIKDMVNYLVDSGLPESFVTNRTDEEIVKMYFAMYDQDIVFLGTETVTMTEYLPSTESLSTGTEATRGVIPESDMTFSITKIANVSYDSTLHLDRINEMYVYVDYEWAVGHPFFTWTDGITVNWDPGVFTFKANSFAAYDYKNTLSSGWITTQTLTSPTELDQGGLGYVVGMAYSEVVMGNTVGALQHKGSAYFTLLPTNSPMYLKNNSSVTAINAMYLHNKNPLGASISFTHTSGFGISVSVPGLSDSVAKAVNVYYTY